MPTFVLAAVLFPVLALAGCQPHEGGEQDPPASARDVVIASAPGTPRPPFQFSEDDSRFLDEIERGCFAYFWDASSPAGQNPTGMVPDRSSGPTVSVAGVGFQLSALVIGVERGWVTRELAAGRAVQIARALRDNPENRKHGLFYHFIDGATAGQPALVNNDCVSTVDSALLFAGLLTASQYFGGEVGAAAEDLFRAADWAVFVDPNAVKPHERGFVSLGWRPTDPKQPTGGGILLPYYWVDSGDEHRLVTFLGVCAPEEPKRVDPQIYYRQRRMLGSYANEYGTTGTFVWFPWSGAMFTNVFANCWMDYASMGADNPERFLGKNSEVARPRVDWWENSRRAVMLHRLKARELSGKVPTLGEHAWGLSASDVRTGYGVPGVFPRPIVPKGSRPEFDHAVFDAKDQPGDGTIAPYGAGSTIMFEPGAALDALRWYRGLKGTAGSALVWRDPGQGGWGFRDSFNLGRPGEETWVASDCVAIDQGPLLLAVENARTGLIWRVFHAHPFVKDGMARLGLKVSRPRGNTGS